MRRVTVIALCAWVAMATACAPRLVPAPTIGTPRYPEYIQPIVPPEWAGSALADHQDRAWRFLQTGDLRNAARELALALQRDSGFTPAQAAQGYVALARGDAGEALVQFDRALATDGTSVSALVGRGQALVDLQREADAIGAFDLALGIDPTLVEVQRRTDVLRFQVLEANLAVARDAALDNRFDEAEAAYRTAIASSPDSAFLHRELAEVVERRGDLGLALAYFRRAAELDPGDTVALVAIARLLEAQRDFAGAIRAYDRAMLLDPAPRIAAQREAVRVRLEFEGLPAQYREIAAAPQLTRAGLAALIGVRLAPLVSPIATREPVVLTDIRATWAEPWIMTVIQAGVMEGYPNHTFQPDMAVPRIDLAEVVTELLTRAAPPDLRSWQASRRTFNDLSTAHLLYPAASTAVASGVMESSGGGFDPSRPVSGREAMEAIERLEALVGPAASPTVNAR